MMTDPIADMLTRIRNANKALQETTEMPTSRQKVEIARLLKEEGYIVGYSVRKGESFDTPQARLEAGTPRIRSKGSPAARPRGNGHCDHVDVQGSGHEQDRRARGHRRRGHLLRLVAQ